MITGIYGNFTLVAGYYYTGDGKNYSVRSTPSPLPYFWIPEENMELRVRRDHVPYDVWERQGYLQTTEGNVVHYGYIEKFIERLGERFNIR